MRRRFSLVGPGRVGSSLALALMKRGWNCDTLVAVGDVESEVKELRNHFSSSKIVQTPSALGSRFDVLFLTVADGKIEETADGLAQNAGVDWDGKTVFHVSGFIKVGVLSGLKKRGATVGAFHPISPFAVKFAPERAEGICYDFLGDPAARRVARLLAMALSSRLILLKSERERQLLHVASVIVSNFTVIGTRAAEDILAGFVDRRDIDLLTRGLLSSTFSNLTNSDGGKALTGPLARADATVISSHLESLANKPALLQFYRSSSRLGIEMLIKEERDPNRRRNLMTIKKLLEE